MYIYIYTYIYRYVYIYIYLCLAVDTLAQAMSTFTYVLWWAFVEVVWWLLWLVWYIRFALFLLWNEMVFWINLLWGLALLLVPAARARVVSRGDQ